MARKTGNRKQQVNSRGSKASSLERTKQAELPPMSVRAAAAAKRVTGNSLKAKQARKEALAAVLASKAS